MEATLYKILTPVMLIGGVFFRAVIKAFDMRQYDSYHSRKRVFIGYEILRQKELNLRFHVNLFHMKLFLLVY